ncbi:LacI family DNA-binding transcriptional regulator [Pengzhenrongella sp.]|jgi:LacI family transcriptional regulator|uniref:LacI family DNA-binding transcriptional regulator n=1 Tax=Pengzhenrongella sp. TaxID=2888820 RepID=UPI002F947DD4
MTHSAVPPARHAVTRDDVARYAGVSSAVVSYVVNGGPRPVAASTALRVRQAIKVLGYRPNASARALRTGTTRLLGLVVPEIGNPLFAELAVAIEESAAQRGYDVMLTNSEGDPDRERRQVSNLVARQVDGVILTTMRTGSDVALLPLDGVPTVLLNRFDAVPGFDTVGVEAEAGAFLGTAHLIEHGHERIALVIGGGPAGHIEARERGWTAATRRAGLDDGPIARDDFSRAGGHRAALRLFGSPHPPSAAFVSSDMQAVGVLRALDELGLRVPQDVALVSFDGTQESEYTLPRLTVVKQPVQEMAAAAVERVLAIGADSSNEHSLHAPRLVIGGSCGCLGPAASSEVRPALG